MTTDQFRDLARSLGVSDFTMKNILAARCDWLCQRAHKGHAHDGCNYNAVHLPIGAWFCNKCAYTAKCPDCPTVAQLLAWGEAVAMADIKDSPWVDALRSVKP